MSQYIWAMLILIISREIPEERNGSKSLSGYSYSCKHRHILKNLVPINLYLFFMINEWYLKSTYQ